MKGIKIFWNMDAKKILDSWMLRKLFVVIVENLKVLSDWHYKMTTQMFLSCQ